MDMRSVRGVVFDLDGTLCRYAVRIDEAMAETLDRLGLPADALGDLSVAADRYNALWEQFEFARQTAGVTRAAVWGRLVEEHPSIDPRLAPQLAAAYTDIRMPSVELFPGAMDLLVALRGPYRLGLLTNGPSDMQWPKIGRLRISSRFDAIVVAGDSGIYKPDPRAFASVLADLNLAPEHALFVGDSLPMDIAGARGARMASVWIRRNGQTPPPDIEPALTIDRVTDLTEVLL